MTGLLLSNLGTPDQATTLAVRRYLRQFLSDPRVLDIGALGRWALLNLIILPTRPAKSAAAYRKIWGEGSPLLRYGRDLVTAVQGKLGAEWAVELGMRYGEPSIEAALESLRKKNVDRIVFFPLYPQYAASSTGSSIEELYRIAAKRWVTPSIATVEPFYEDVGFVRAFAEVGRQAIDDAKPDHVLFSYHGLPERQVVKTDDTGAHCLKSEACCDRIVAANRHCYRAQCFATTRALVDALQLTMPHSVSFQSRLGRTPWIRPYTDLVLPELAQKGVKRVVVFCPAFVADCLETLEEIGIRAKEQWRDLGGESLSLVPSLNATPAWVDAVVALVHAQARRFDGER
jgi:ferrochelatase